MRRGEEPGVVRCRAEYARARTAADSARVDRLTLRDTTGELDPLDCGFLRSRAGGGLR